MKSVTFIGHPLVVGQIEAHEVLKVQQRGHQASELVSQPKVRETHIEEGSEQYAYLRHNKTLIYFQNLYIVGRGVK